VSDEAASPVPRQDLVQEADRILAASRDVGVVVRLTGGLAVRKRCPSASRPPLARDYADVDLVTRYGSQDALTRTMQSLGYVQDETFNSLHGRSRLYYIDPHNQRHVDVFVDQIRMCHTIDVASRLERLDDTLTVSDLLLTKLQVVELTHKDLLDLLALLLDHHLSTEGDDTFDSAYLTKCLGRDWPLWQTSRLTLHKVLDRVDGILPSAESDAVKEQARVLLTFFESCPKSLRWKTRAVVGGHVRWYLLPEEVEA
jgi:hypothetical protein